MGAARRLHRMRWLPTSVVVLALAAGSVSAYDWMQFGGNPQHSGSNTAGYFMAYDAKSGQPLWKFNTGSGIFSSPSVYMVDGEESVTVASGGGERGRRGGDLVLSFALPPR